LTSGITETEICDNGGTVVAAVRDEMGRVKKKKDRERERERGGRRIINEFRGPAGFLSAAIPTLGALTR